VVHFRVKVTEGTGSFPLFLEERAMARILVVDDEAEVLDFFQAELTALYHEVETARNGREAIEKMKTHRPHLMLLDVKMPVMDGFQTLSEAKKINPRLVVVLVTATAQIDIASRAIQQGADEYITKPVDLEKLNRILTTKISELLG
jgi:two-component system response regulator AtoC